MTVLPEFDTSLEKLKKGSRQMKFLHALVALFVLSLGAIFFTGCATTGGEVAVGWGSGQDRHHRPPTARRHGPPAHAPAYGYRAKHAYWYYPNSYVYFDAARRVYFYLEDDNWRVSVSLPRYFQVNLGGHVVIEMDSDRPYTRFDDHRKEFPPGHKKKNKNKKNKGKKW